MNQPLFCNRVKCKNSRRAAAAFRLTLAEFVTGVGVTLLILGGMAADSPGTGSYWAAGVVAAGIAIAAVGQALEGRRQK